MNSVDTHTVLRPVLLLSKCLGVAPFSLSGQIGSRVLQTSFQDILYSVVFFVVSFILIFYQSDIWRISPTICSVSEKAISFSVVIQFVLSSFLCVVKRHKITDACNQLSVLNALLNFSCRCVWNKIVLILTSHLCLVSLIFGTYIVCELIYLENVNLLSFSALTALSISSLSVEFQIVGLLMILKRLISDLNNSIRGLGRVKGNKNEACSCSKQPKGKSDPIFLTSNHQEQGKNIDISEKELMKKKIINFREIQDSLCGTSETLNSAYSFLLLYTIGKTFICLTQSLYYILLNLFMAVTDKSCGIDRPHVYFIWFVYYSVKLVWLVYYNSSTIQQANRTAVLVHKLIGKTREPQIREELRLFSLQLLHRKVQFTACGFFPLDFTLLYSIVGAVTTYLVILIQFQLSLKNPQTNSTTPAPTVGTTFIPMLFTSTEQPSMF